jgi:uncharacterized protein DUF3750
VQSRRRFRRPLWLAFVAIFLAPVLIGAGDLAYHGGPRHWSNWDRTVTSELPPAAEHPQARIMVMSGRTRGWKGVVAVHSWIVVKGENERTWRRYDVAGWGDPVRMNWWPPDLWFGEHGRVVLDVKGEQAQALIPRIDAAIKNYRYVHAGDYRIWPGPNSNTFVAAILRAIPEAGVTLPANAIGRDFRAWFEGIEINVLGLVAGLDVRDPGIKLPGFGRIGFDGLAATAAPQPAR